MAPGYGCSTRDRRCTPSEYEVSASTNVAKAVIATSITAAIQVPTFALSNCRISIKKSLTGVCSSRASRNRHVELSYWHISSRDHQDPASALAANQKSVHPMQTCTINMRVVHGCSLRRLETVGTLGRPAVNWNSVGAIRQQPN